MKKVLILIIGITFCSTISFSQQGQSFPIKVGAAKINITPSAKEFPSNFLGVNDSIYSRAIVIDNGTTSAALISVDVGMFRDNNWENITQHIEKELGIPVSNILLTATHTHSVPFNMGGEKLEQNIFESVKQAKVKLQPACVGYGTGVSYINVNRNIIDPKTRTWWEGPTYDGPSDKTVTVVSFEDLDGTPIAVYYNYAMHAVLTGNLDLIAKAGSLDHIQPVIITF